MTTLRGTVLGGRFRYFLNIFSSVSGVRGEKGGGILIWNIERGGEFQGGEAGWCTPVLRGCGGGGEGGGLNIAFSAPKCSPRVASEWPSSLHRDGRIASSVGYKIGAH